VLGNLDDRQVADESFIHSQLAQDWKYHGRPIVFLATRARQPVPSGLVASWVE
jgi:hypothetical protein